MPYNATQQITSLPVLAIAVTIVATPSQPWTAGQALSLIATVLKDGVPWAGTSVKFELEIPNIRFTVIGTVITDALGKATLNLTMPWQIDGASPQTVPCNKINFIATETTSNIWGVTSGNVAFPTRVSVVTSLTQVVPNQPFDITGKLEYESASGTWTGFGGKTVSLFYDGTKIADVSTDINGNYIYSFARILIAGVYTIKATYVGAGFLALQEERILVGIPPLKTTAIIAGILALFGVGVGALVYKRR